jgi:hypothetical protein
MPAIATLPLLVCAGMTTLSAGISLGFSLAAARSAQGPARALALYASVRSLALFAASLASFVVGGTGWLEAIAASMIMVQAGDALVGVSIKNRMKTIGPFITAAVNAAALWWFLS